MIEELIQSYPDEYTADEIQRLIWAEIGTWLHIDLIKKIRQVAKVLDKKTDK